MKTYLVVRNAGGFDLVKIRAHTKYDAIFKIHCGQGEYIVPTPRQRIVLEKLSGTMPSGSVAEIPNRWFDPKTKEKLDKKKLHELLKQVREAI